MNCKKSAIKIDVSRTNTQTHRAAFSADAIERILAERICSDAGIEIEAPGTSVNVHLSCRMGNYGSEYEALVTVTIDYEKLPAALVG